MSQPATRVPGVLVPGGTTDYVAPPPPTGDPNFDACYDAKLKGTHLSNTTKLHLSAGGLATNMHVTPPLSHLSARLRDDHFNVEFLGAHLDAGNVRLCP